MPVRSLPRVSFPHYTTDTGEVFEKGDKFTVTGEYGQFTFLGHTIAPKGEWIDAYGGQFRSFRPERIKKKV